MPDLSRKILILEDEGAVRDSLVDYFEDRLWRPLPFADAESALKDIAQHRPLAVIVDIRLSGMSGEVFIRHAHLRCPGAVFVICTGSPDFRLTDDLKALPHVSQHVFFKPVLDLQALEAEIERLIHTIRGNRDD